MEHEYLLKIVHVGDSGVGKTNLLGRFCEENIHESGRYIATIGIDFRIKTVVVDRKVVKLQMWDTAGQERFHSLAKTYYRLAHGFIVCYDITKPASFDNVQFWVSEIQAASARSPEEWSMVLVANKLDVADEPERQGQVTERQGQKKAKDLGVPFFEVSAKLNEHVTDVYTELVRNMLRQSGVEPEARPLEDSVGSKMSKLSHSNGHLPDKVSTRKCCS